jgi:2-polyprenyl-6-methoxyphenol hydroxylase-like FAD-dependent oxidoreductase
MPDQDPIERIGPYVYRHFQPPQLPAQQHATVAIVGGGPVGLATALGLARQGVASVVIEADDSVCVGSRAICLSRRSLEICDRLGALPELMQRGLPWSGGRSCWQDTEVFRFSMPPFWLRLAPALPTTAPSRPKRASLQRRPSPRSTASNSARSCSMRSFWPSRAAQRNPRRTSSALKCWTS